MRRIRGYLAPSLSLSEVLVSFAGRHHIRQFLVSGPAESFGEKVCEVVFGFYAGKLIPMHEGLYQCVWSWL